MSPKIVPLLNRPGSFGTRRETLDEGEDVGQLFCLGRGVVCVCVGMLFVIPVVLDGLSML
jgi:hypothetical protein